MSLDQPDLYQVLGVAYDADSDTIKKAFRKLARQFHPDTNPGINDTYIKQVNDAYEVLKDAAKRLAYDTHLYHAWQWQESQRQSEPPADNHNQYAYQHSSTRYTRANTQHENTSSPYAGYENWEKTVDQEESYYEFKQTEGDIYSSESPSAAYSESAKKVRGWFIGVVISIFVIVVILGGSSWISGSINTVFTPNAQPQSNAFKAGTTWEGNVYATNSGFTQIVLTIDVLSYEDFSGEVYWPSYGNAKMHVEGISAIQMNAMQDLHWKYVSSCPGGVYVHFTQPQLRQPQSSGPLSMDTIYYAVACGNSIRGVWFYPNGLESPGGEFALSMKSS